MNAQVEEIFQEVKGLVLLMDGTAQEQTFIFDSSHVYETMLAANKVKGDNKYPKAVVVVDAGRVNEGVAMQRNCTLSFDTIFVFKKNSGDQRSAPEQCRAFVDEFEQIVTRNYSLGGLVLNTSILEWTTDSGFADPEGVVWIKLGVEYRKTMP